MDPVVERTHDKEGFVMIDELIKLHYELYLPPSYSPTCPKVLMMMGAFATAVHFANEARVIANAGYEVCIYDHRGVAKSGPASKEQQTAELLASDAVVLIDTLWGLNTAVHVYGASMGGMVAQELAVLLLPQRRLLSLGLAVTCRGLKPFGGLLSPIIIPQVLKLILQTWYWDSRPALVRRLMRLLLSRSILDTIHPSGETLGAVYFREWLAHFEDFWTLTDHTVGACHACVVLTHYLSEKKMEMIRDSGVPVLCQVSTRDHVIPAPMQFDLAARLKARTVTFPTGHMGVLPWKDQFHKLLLEQFAMGDALRGIHCAEAARIARIQQQQQALLLPQWRSVLLLQPALSASSAVSSSSSSRSSGEYLVSPTAAAAGDLIRSSGDMSSVISDESAADLTIDVADWSGSSSSGGGVKKDTIQQQELQQGLAMA